MSEYMTLRIPFTFRLPLHILPITLDYLLAANTNVAIALARYLGQTDP
jgi:hypothetical protein